jgi:ADP-ribosylglycohydrolase
VNEKAIERARTSLDGLSVGDAFGERFFGAGVSQIMTRTLPPAPWRWTDDTQMALAIVDVLAAHGAIVEDALAQRFVQRFDMSRGYGGGAVQWMDRVGRGEPWRHVAAGLFHGTGSYGNGGAMRAAPIGAYFAGDVSRAAQEGKRSAEVTHAHLEGQAGAIAIAVAAAIVSGGKSPRGAELLRAVAEYVPPGLTRQGILRAMTLDPSDPEGAAEVLGSGQDVSSQDTVPFALFTAAHSLDDYALAMWRTVSGLGDRDTTCAIAGGIVSLSAPIPTAWLAAREAIR